MSKKYFGKYEGPLGPAWTAAKQLRPEYNIAPNQEPAGVPSPQQSQPISDIVGGVTDQPTIFSKYVPDFTQPNDVVLTPALQQELSRNTVDLSKAPTFDMDAYDRAISRAAELPTLIGQKNNIDLSKARLYAESLRSPNQVQTDLSPLMQWLQNKSKQPIGYKAPVNASKSDSTIKSWDTLQDNIKDYNKTLNEAVKASGGEKLINTTDLSKLTMGLKDESKDDRINDAKNASKFYDDFQLFKPTQAILAQKEGLERLKTALKRNDATGARAAVLAMLETSGLKPITEQERTYMQKTPGLLNTINSIAKYVTNNPGEDFLTKIDRAQLKAFMDLTAKRLELRQAEVERAYIEGPRGGTRWATAGLKSREAAALAIYPTFRSDTPEEKEEKKAGPTKEQLAKAAAHAAERKKRNDEFRKQLLSPDKPKGGK